MKDPPADDGIHLAHGGHTVGATEPFRRGERAGNRSCGRVQGDDDVGSAAVDEEQAVGGHGQTVRSSGGGLRGREPAQFATAGHIEGYDFVINAVDCVNRSCCYVLGHHRCRQDQGAKYRKIPHDCFLHAVSAGFGPYLR